MAPLSSGRSAFSGALLSSAADSTSCSTPDPVAPSHVGQAPSILVGQVKLVTLFFTSYKLDPPYIKPASNWAEHNTDYHV